MKRCIENPFRQFNVHGSVHRELTSVTAQQDATPYSLLYFCNLLYIFRVVTPPIIRGTVIIASGTGQTSENVVCEVGQR
jgi:hypothetical protein